MPPETPRDYQVGYGKPPRHTRFKRGQSGNPRGRPRESKNLPTLLTEALNERVIVAENEGRRKITKREAIITQLVNRSAKADLRAIKILLDIIQDIECRTEPTSPETSFGLADEKVIEQLKARLNGAKLESDDRERNPGRVRGSAAAGLRHLCCALLPRPQPAGRARDELASRGHRGEADRGARRQDPAADHQPAASSFEIADGLDRVPCVLPRA
jgi:hypothetical protein